MKVFEDIKTALKGKPLPPSPPIIQNEPKRKILIVEDDQSLASALKDVFEQADFEVIQAENGAKGLDAVIKYDPSIILLDLMMPVMDGKVMLRKLREIPQYKQLPVIVLTNAGQVENIHETVDFDNAIEFLGKSNVSLEEIVAKVKRTH